MHLQASKEGKRNKNGRKRKTEVKQKDGTVKVIRKYKTKKRFGRSINRRTCKISQLELKRKVEAVEVSMQK